ncbi:MAG: hypothetical protein HY460_03060 [Parcubacteria group bacterium]|nr:hypothetical protein [Parcubacteria group bacterium]
MNLLRSYNASMSGEGGHESGKRGYTRSKDGKILSPHQFSSPRSASSTPEPSNEVFSSTQGNLERSYGIRIELSPQQKLWPMRKQFLERLAEELGSLDEKERRVLRTGSRIQQVDDQESGFIAMLFLARTWRRGFYEETVFLQSKGSMKAVLQKLSNSLVWM